MSQVLNGGDGVISWKSFVPMTQQKLCLTHCETCSKGYDSLRIYHRALKSNFQSYTGMQHANVFMTDVVVTWNVDGKMQKKQGEGKSCLSHSLQCWGPS